MDEENNLDDVEYTEPTDDDSIAKKAPWWLISIGLHALIIIISLFIIAILPTQSHPDPVTMNTLGQPQFQLDSKIIELEPTTKKIEESDKQIESTEKQKTEDQSLEFDKKEAVNMEELKFKAKTHTNNFAKQLPSNSRVVAHSLLLNRMGDMKIKSLKEGGGNDKSERAVAEALSWLARHQNEDGSWSITGCTKNCGKYGRKGDCNPVEGDEEYDIGATGLALLAFLGEGYYPGGYSKLSNEGISYDNITKRGLKFLMRKQSPDGRIGDDTPHMMYNHVIAALALTEGFSLTNNGMLQNAAQKAVNFTIDAQNRGNEEGETGERKMAWRYKPRTGYNEEGANDSSITGWCAMLLKSAENAKLSFPKSAYEGIKRWFDTATDEESGIVGYDKQWRNRMPLGASIKGLNDRRHFDVQPAVTAIAIMSRLFINKKTDPTMKKSVEFIINEYLPEWDQENRKADFYYWYNASYALFQYYPKNSKEWLKWNNAIHKTLIESKKQNMSNGTCVQGSWDPVDRWSCKGGRVCTTALGTLILQVYYRYAQLKDKW